MMKFLPVPSAILCLFLFAPLAHAGDNVVGTTTYFESYNAVIESCVRIVPIPGGEYDRGDINDEADLCEIDIYSPKVAICPKIWSTSAAVVVYDISAGKFEDERRDFQSLICVGGKVAKYVADGVLAKLKFTINQATTSSTFSTSSLLYYHLSRYFDLSLEVPVAVWRNMDAQILLSEVAAGGVIYTNNNNQKVMINAAWHTLVDLINDPSTYVREGSFGIPADTLTSDGDKVYGAFLDASGTNWGRELNRSAASTWSAENYIDLQLTPEFIALSTDAPIGEAIDFGLIVGTAGLSDEDKLAAVLTPQQLAFSMRDLSEVLLIDYIMSQQDRMGNVDYKAYYYWTDNGFVARETVKGSKPGKGGIPEDAVLILRMELNDNDAGGRYEYDNRTMLFGVLEQLRHFDAKTYRLLLEFNADLQAKGPVHTWLTNSLGLRASKVQHIVDNTALATGILQTACEAGSLRFDLSPKQFFANGFVRDDLQACTLAGTQVQNFETTPTPIGQ